MGQVLQVLHVLEQRRLEEERERAIERAAIVKSVEGRRDRMCWGEDVIWKCFVFYRGGSVVTVFTNGRLYGERPCQHDLVRLAAHYDLLYPPCGQSYGGPYHGFRLAEERTMNRVDLYNHLLLVLQEFAPGFVPDLLAIVAAYDDFPAPYEMSVQFSGFGPN